MSHYNHSIQSVIRMTPTAFGVSFNLNLQSLKHSREGMCHVTHESCCICEWVMSHMWMSHVTQVNESCHAGEWVMSRMWMSHVTQVNESCHTCERFMSHRWMSHVTRSNASCQHMRKHHVAPTHVSCHSHECVMSHIWMSTVTRMNESCHTYEWVTSKLYARQTFHDSSIWQTHPMTLLNAK